MVHMCKMMISPGIFFILKNFDFLGCLGGGTHLRNSIAYDHDFWYTCVKWWHLQMLFSFFQDFHFFKIFIFWVIRRVKGLKMAQNGKKFCLSHSISQEPYLIWLWFMGHLCKMMVSPAIFSFFQNSDFFYF